MAVVGVAVVALCSSAPAARADGQLDPSFGNGGRVDLSLATSSGVEGANVVIPVGGGSFLAVGAGEGKGAWVTQTLANGALDGGFGTGGGTYFQPSSYSFAASAAREANGAIVVAGGAEAGADFDTLLARLTPQGALDPAFGNDPPHPSGDGIGVYDLGGDDLAEGVALDPEGKILIAGRTGTNPNHDVLLARFNQDGSLDSSFGGATGVHTDLGGNDEAVAVAMQGSRIIVLANSGGTVYALGYRLDGTLDPAFGGGDGIAPVSFPISSEGRALLVREDGSIVVLGSASGQALIGRLQPDGSPDPGFGNGGVTSFSLGAPVTGTYVSALAQSDDGKLIAVGTAYTSAPSSQIVLFRTLANGQPDPSWGTGGTVSFEVPAKTFESGWGIAVEPDRRIVVGGETYDGTNDDRLLLRVLGDTTPPDTRISSAPPSTSRTPLSPATLAFEAVGDTHTSFECDLTSPVARPRRKHRHRRHHHHHRRHRHALVSASTSTTTTGFGPCGSPLTYAKLSAPGTYTFAVRAIDPAGNVDPTPATASFAVLAKKHHKRHHKKHHHRKHHRGKRS